MRLLVLAVLAVVGGFVSQFAHGNTYSSRQYYGGWNKHPTKNYHYRAYYYKPTKDYYGYKHQYATYWPSYRKTYKENYYIYYNPYQKKYWGRVPCYREAKYEGKPYYEILQEADRRPEVKDIPEKAFQKMDKMPNIPESKDEVPMDLPPDDTPPNIVTE